MPKCKTAKRHGGPLTAEGPWSARRCAQGFTLLEAILALALMIILLSGVYSFYATSLRARAVGGQIALDAMLARSLLEEITDHIRHATDIVPGDGIGFRGDKHGITIVRTRMPELYAFEVYDLLRDELPPAQMDLVRIRYELLWDEELVDDEDVPLCHGLWRSTQKTFDPNPRFIVQDEAKVGEGEEEAREAQEQLAVPQIDGELIAPEIKYLKIQYFDGAEWRDQWQVADEEGGLDTGQAAATGKGTYALPQAVKITVGKVRVPPEDEQFNLAAEAENKEEDEEEDELKEYHPDRFTMVVHLFQADPTLLSSRKYGVADQFGREKGEP